MIQQKTFFWLSGLIVFIALLYLLRDVLLPFVAGMAVAYFLDPVCDWLEKKGCSRTIATSIVTAIFFFILIVILILVAPLLLDRIAELIEKIPNYVDSIGSKFQNAVAFVQPHLDGQDLSVVAKKAVDYSGSIVKWLINGISGFVGGVSAVANVISLLVITPIVAFYLLRDWDLITSKIDSWLPRAQSAIIREQVLAVDRTLNGFVRGQSMVCLLLGSFYAAGLFLLGLDFGILLGFATGLISFIPYFGMLIGFGIGLGLAIAQFDSITMIGMVVAVFAIGQILEGYVLTPRMVGEQVGLHPVWIIFALLAGGALFGFLGIMLAVPVAAVIGVLIRFSIAQYLKSKMYDQPASSQTAGRVKK